MGPKNEWPDEADKGGLSSWDIAHPRWGPAEIGALYRYSSSDGFGAVLMTEGPVVKDFVYGTTPFRLWCKANSEAILRKWPDVKEHRLIIVTSVYTTRFAMINAGSGTEKEISIGFRAGTIQIGEVGPSSAWYTAQDDSGWVASEASEPNERKVVFFGGLYFRYRRLAAVQPQSYAFSAGDSIEKAKFRGVDLEGREFRLADMLVTSEVKGEMMEMPQDVEDDDSF